MHLLSDIISAFGSRVGIGVHPGEKTAYLMRNTMYPGIPMSLEIGVRVGEQEYVLPLTKNGKEFCFLEQEMTPNTLTITGIDDYSTLSVQFTLMSLFRPRDVRFSTTPAVYADVRVKRLKTRYRWKDVNTGRVDGTLFVRFDQKVFDLTPAEQGYYVDYDYEYGRARTDDGRGAVVHTTHAHDLISVIEGEATPRGIELPFSLEIGEYGGHIRFAWCAYDEPMLQVDGEYADYKYKEYFDSLEAVGDWCRANWQEIESNTARVDGIFCAHNLSNDFTHLVSQAFHSYLPNTWYCKRGNEDWYSCWEGGGYFQSSVDVEYSQAPFYVSVWPELLEMELLEWTEHTMDGAEVLGEAGRGTRLMKHDMGQYCDCNGQRLWIQQELEETTNYILMAHAVWKRTGSRKLLAHAGLVRQFMDFILATDSQGDGIPSYACHTTLDDSCLPLRTGQRLTYIAVKAAAACQVGAELLAAAGDNDTAAYLDFAKRAYATVERDGWREDHYVTCFTDMEGAEGSSIYTENGFSLPAMVGFPMGLDVQRMRTDIRTSVQDTLCRYGCRHADYTDREILKASVHGAYFNAPYVGWISMNETRDVAAMYAGVDLLDMASRYWDWEATVNSREYVLFLDTFYGNSLMFYPRGLAAFGYYEAVLRYYRSEVDGLRGMDPLRADLRVPILSEADWNQGTVPVAESYREGNMICCRENTL